MTGLTSNRARCKIQNTLIAGVIQNFEFVYEISTKMIKRQIEIESASPEEVDESNFRNVLRIAAENGLIADVEAWFGYRLMRNITAHTFHHKKRKRFIRILLYSLKMPENYCKSMVEG